MIKSVCDWGQQVKNSFLNIVLAETLAQIDEGVHVVGADGKTLIYNKAMEKIEGMSAKDVIGKHILEAYSGWQDDNSTLLTVLKTGESIHRSSQKYLNLAGKPIVTVNMTVPLYDGDALVGALEVASNVTDVSNLSEEVIKLRQQLIKPRRKAKQAKQYSFDMLIGEDPKYLQAVKQAFQAALTVRHYRKHCWKLLCLARRVAVLPAQSTGRGYLSKLTAARCS